MFRDGTVFDNASFSVKEIDISSEFYRGLYKRLEFCTYLGRLTVLIERKAANNTTAIFRMPFESLMMFTTYDDNPNEKTAVITVNESAKEVVVRA